MWKVFLRNPSREREGEVDDFTQLDAVVRFCDVGTWSLEMDGRARHAAALATPGYGIELVRDDTTTVTTGPMRHRVWSRDGDSLKLKVHGFDDNVWLKRRLAHPQPATSAPPYNSTEYDVRTGVASTVLRQYVDVNAGTGALVPRRVAGLDLDTDPLLGSDVTGRARWQNLLTLLQELAIAGGNLGFRVAKDTTDLLFQVYEPTDRTSDVMLSVELGNLYGYEYESEVSTVNYAYVGGGGEGTARTVQELGDTDDAITWGRIEQWVDRRDTTDADELTQELTKTLAEGVGRTGLSVNPVDIEGQTFLQDYDLGDRITYVVDGVASTEVVREARILLTPDGPQKTLPGIAPPGQAEVLALFRRLRMAEARIADLERR
ncbi:siphovirus ReqiPepy6 Gp37-like family protein [Saccharothrix variisporea]|uniref:ReqiPepy6 Gp37-like protein n=1 Tax=Saccharothrix variisporea TaxID=543527 RepID=A0A495WZP9_9PSEU|nr:siphovirus ReqiPepy6 Gp37-like family protein [Saccharothrix variisporea]RKT67117.1 ReqiPepy6 Gp37-like protein [Saccharothrix variisporea]